MKQLKIIIYEPYSFNIYGNTRYLLTVFKFIDKSQFEPVLVIPRKAEFVRNMEEMGGRYIVLPPPSRLGRHGGGILKDGIIGKLLTGFDIVRHTYNLLVLINKEHPHIIHCNSIRSLITICVAAKIARKPILWYIKGDLENKILDWIGFRLADKIIFQSEITKNRKYPHLVQKFSSKIVIIHNGIDLEEVANAENKNHDHLKEELSLKKDMVNIVFVGQLYPLKGLEYLIIALGKILETIHNVKLYIIGDHSIPEYINYRNKLDKMIESKKLINHITFTGYRDDVLEILSLMDIFVLPSLSEGVPKSIIEAMALSKPVVATRVGGVVELVRDGETGFSVEPRDPDGLAKALITLIMDKDLRVRFGKSARRIAFENYSIKDNIKKLETIYRIF